MKNVGTRPRQIWVEGERTKPHSMKSGLGGRGGIETGRGKFLVIVGFFSGRAQKVSR